MKCKIIKIVDSDSDEQDKSKKQTKTSNDRKLSEKRSKIRLQIDDEFQTLRTKTQERAVPSELTDYVGPRVSIQDYLAQYNGPQGQRFQKQFDELNIKEYRRVRGDGNCFYTSLGFRLFEIWSNLGQLGEKTQSSFLQLQKLQKNGEPIQGLDLENVYSYFGFKYEQFSDQLFKAKDDVFYLCFQTYIRSLVFRGLEQFKNSGDEMSWLADQFDNNEILEFEQESPICTQVIVYYMAKQFNLEITVVQDSQHQVFGQGNQHKIYLLFNPGHFEILY